MAKMMKKQRGRPKNPIGKVTAGQLVVGNFDTVVGRVLAVHDWCETFGEPCIRISFKDKKNGAAHRTKVIAPRKKKAK